MTKAAASLNSTFRIKHLELKIINIHRSKAQWSKYNIRKWRLTLKSRTMSVVDIITVSLCLNVLFKRFCWFLVMAEVVINSWNRNRPNLYVWLPCKSTLWGTELYWTYFKHAVKADEFHTTIEYLIRNISKHTQAHGGDFADMWTFVGGFFPPGKKKSLSGENTDLKWNQLIRLDGGGLKYERKPSWTFGWRDS